MNIPAITTINELEFYKLSWPQFERLCRDLVASVYPNLQNVREYLSQGYKQEGIDIRGFDKNDGRYVYIQCKKVKSFTARDTEKSISLFESGEFFEDSKTFILCVTSQVDRKYLVKPDRVGGRGVLCIHQRTTYKTLDFKSVQFK